MNSARLLMLLAAGAACRADAPASDPPAAPQVETTQIADGVYQFRYNAHNALFVATPAGVVAFDPISTDAASHYAAEIKRVVPDAGLAAIVYSHRDADHATGAPVLRAAFGESAPIYAHHNARQPLLEAATPDLPPPDSTFDRQVTIGQGENRIELHYLGKSHSDDMIVAVIPRTETAFAVDFVAHDRLGYRDLSSFHFPDMFDAMESLLTLPFERIVFGHGPPGDRESIVRQIQYYRDLHAAVRGAIDSGLTEDQAAANILLPDYGEWGGYTDWRELNVRGMYRKLAEAAG